jgi:signal transduction histidine kinase
VASRVSVPGSLDGPRARLTNSPLLVDALIGFGLSGLSLVLLLGGAQDIGSYAPYSIVLLFLQTLPLVFRSRFPVAVLAVTLTATVLHAAFAEDELTTTLGSLVALFTVAERHDRRTSAVAALVMGAALGGLIAWVGGLPGALSSLVSTELAVFVAWVLGTWSRARRRHVGTVEERARRAEQEREQLAAEAVREERERIARELHDVITHHVSVIVIQAGAGLRALERRPDDARAALIAIDGSGRQALSDMRRMLGILGPRAGEAGTSATAADHDALAPMPGLDRLGELIERVRDAGLPVELAIEGEPRALDPGVELSAYRIVQEALTNSLKHAPGARARVAVSYEPEAIEVRIADTGGRGAPSEVPAGQGHGLIGMRERVAMFCGRFEVPRAAASACSRGWLRRAGATR